MDDRQTQPAADVFRSNSTIERMFVVRESDKFDMKLLEAMLDQTLARHRDLPGASEAMRLKLDPFKNPERHDATRLSGTGFNAVLYAIDGSLFLVWAGSAAKEDANRDNPFVKRLTELVNRYQPRDLMASTFSRLVRSERHSPKLKIALQDAATKVQVREIELQMKLQTSGMMWDLLSFMAAQDRDNIEMRLALGLMYKARTTGLPPDRAIELPLGYEFVDGKLEHLDDEPTRAAVREMIAILGTEQTARRKTEALGALGITNRALRMYYDELATVADSRSPSESIRTLNRHLELYRSGQWHFRRKIPPVELNDFGGLPVETDDSPGGTGNAADQHYVTAVFDVGLPDGGWASDPLFEAWEAQVREASERTEGKNGLGRMHRPLIGYPAWTVGDRSYKLTAHYPDLYQLRSRPSELEGGWDALKSESQMELKLRSEDLYEGVTSATLTALTQGHPIKFLETIDGVDDEIDPSLVVIADRGTRKAWLVAEREEIDRQLDIAVDAHTKTTDRLADRYARRARDLEDRLTDLDRRLDELDNEGVRDDPPEVTIRFDQVLRALGHLTAGDPRVDASVGEQLRTIIKNLRVQRHDDATARLTFDLWLPGRNHLVVLPDVQGFSPYFQAGERYNPSRAAHRQVPEEEVLEVLRDGRGAAAVHDLFGGHRYSNTQHSGNLLRNAYPEGPTHWRAAVLFHPIRTVRLGAVEYLENGTITNPDPTFVTSLIAGMENMKKWSYRPLLDMNLKRQVVVDQLAATGRPIDIDEAAKQPELSLVRRSGGWNHHLISRRSRWFDVRLLDKDGSVVMARRCPRCDRADLRVVVLPEAGALVCPGCHRDIDHGRTFAEAYLTLGDPIIWPRAQDPKGGKSLPWQRALQAWPERPLTLEQAAELAGTSRAALASHLHDVLADGLIEHVGYEPQPSGLSPRLYSPRTEASSTG